MEKKEEEWPVAKEQKGEVFTSTVTLEPKTTQVPEIAMKDVEVEVRTQAHPFAASCLPARSCCTAPACAAAPRFAREQRCERLRGGSWLQVPRTVVHTEEIQKPVPVEREVMVDKPYTEQVEVEVEKPVEKTRQVEVEKPVTRYEERTVQKPVTVDKTLETQARRCCSPLCVCCCRAALARVSLLWLCQLVDTASRAGLCVQPLMTRTATDGSRGVCRR